MAALLVLSVLPSAGAQSPSPVRIEAPAPLELEILRGTRWVPGGRTPRLLEPGALFRLAGDTTTFVAPTSGVARIAPGSGTSAVGGPLVGVGALLVLVGAVGVVLTPGSPGSAVNGSSGQDVFAGSDGKGFFSGVRGAFWTIGLVGLASLGTGVALLVTDRPTVTLAPLEQSVRLFPSVSLTPRGLVF